MDWDKIAKVTVFEGIDENGNRYLPQFIADYRKIHTGSEPIIIGCERCLENYYRKYIQYLKTINKMKNTSTTTAKLKLMYQGVKLKFGAKKHINNANMTQAEAEELLAKHPKGAGLFDILPIVKERADKDLTKAELNTKYEGLKKGTKKEMLAEIAERAATAAE